MASLSQAVATRPSHPITGRNGIIDKYFYLAMSLLAVALVIAGFGRTVNSNLLHADVPRPSILWVHAVTFSTWILFFVLQSALVRTHNVRIHRSLGWFGAALGVFMVPLGITTAVIMARFKAHQLHELDASLFLSVPFLDISCFAVFFTLAVYWRRKPELHRRFIFLATSVLLAAAVGRLPYLGESRFFYIGVDVVILFGVVRDLLVNRRIHTIYRVALPVLIVLQTCASFLAFDAPAWWSRIAHSIAG